MRIRAFGFVGLRFFGRESTISHSGSSLLLMEISGCVERKFRDALGSELPGSFVCSRSISEESERRSMGKIRRKRFRNPDLTLSFAFP
jgi:hypothetical protein